MDALQIGPTGPSITELLVRAFRYRLMADTALDAKAKALLLEEADSLEQKATELGGRG